jgi:hypothetical protein
MLNIGPEKPILSLKALFIGLFKFLKIIFNTVIICCTLRIAGPVDRRDLGHRLSFGIRWERLPDDYYSKLN